MTYELFNVITLTQPLATQGLEIGAIGTIVEIYKNPYVAYEVEFCDQYGRTLVQLVLTSDLFQLYCPPVEHDL
jgi:hypothetical protein